ncbi:MAG: hypothetical protein ABIG44_02165, partial [Planctomycetota bacterium]
MSNRLKRVLVLMSLGGMSFFFWGFAGTGCQPFAENQPFINFMTDVGNYAIDVGVDQALSTCTANFNTWFNTPITNLYQDLWTSGV